MDQSDQNYNPFVDRVFPAKIDGSTNSAGTWLYAWTEQILDGITGALEDASPARTGTTSSGYAYEINNNASVATNTLVWMRFRGMRVGQPVYDFTAPDNTSTAGLPVANTTQAGIVSITTQAMSGTKSFETTAGTLTARATFDVDNAIGSNVLEIREIDSGVADIADGSTDGSYNRRGQLYPTQLILGRNAADETGMVVAKNVTGWTIYADKDAGSLNGILFDYNPSSVGYSYLLLRGDGTNPAYYAIQPSGGATAISVGASATTGGLTFVGGLYISGSAAIAVGSITGLGTGVATFLATPSSANLLAAVTDETGTGALVFATTPTLVTPILGTPTSGTLTNCTGTASGLTAGNATVAATVTVADTADTTCWVGLFESATGNLAAKTDGAMTYDASTGILSTSVTVPNSGFKIQDTDASHAWTVTLSDGLTANRTLNLALGNAADRTVTLSGNLDVSANSAISGTAYVVSGTDVAIADGGTGASTAADAFANLKQAASDTATGVVEIAVQSEMEAGSDTGRVVTPGRQHYHPSACKAWVLFDGTGTPAITADYNFDSVSDDGTGLWTLTLTVTMSAATYCVVASSGVPQQAMGTFTTTTFLYTARNSTGTLTDSSTNMAAVFGDL